MENTYVLISTYDNIFEAELARGLLENNGIPAQLNNELMNTILPSFAADEYRPELSVPEDKAELALQILESATDGFSTHRMLKDAGALLDGHFLLTSGRHSSKYVEKIKLFQDPVRVVELCEMLAARLSVYDFDVVIGPAYGGIVLAFEVARMLNKAFVFTQRKDEKMVVRSGFDLSAHKNAVIIEDIVTTGGSVKEVIDCAKEHDTNVVAVGAIVDRSNGSVDFGCPLEALLTLDIPSWDKDSCELCQAGKPITKPGRSDK